MGKIYQSVNLSLLTLIVLKLYPEVSYYGDVVSQILLALVAIGGLIVCALWLFGFIVDFIEKRPQRTREKQELKAISRSLKAIDQINKTL